MSINKQLENITMFSGKLKEEREYWINKLLDNSGATGFPFDNYIHSTRGYEKSNIRFKFSKSISKEIFSMSNNSEQGIYMILLSAVFYILYKYSGNEDLIIGSMLLRTKSNDSPMDNFIALRSKINRSDNFKEFLTELKHTVIEANKYINYSFSKVLELIQSDQDDCVPFKTMVLFENFHNKVSIESMEFNTIFKFKKIEDSVECDLEFNSMIFQKETMEGIVRGVINYFNCVLSNPNMKISEIEIIDAEEKLKLLNEFNNTTSGYAVKKTIHELFQEKVEAMPGKIAVVFEDKVLTYSELNEKSNQLARVLRGKGVRQDNIVGIMVERSIEMVVGILAILKAGGAYLPIDPNFPRSRKDYILDNSNINIILVNDRSGEIEKFNGQIVNINNEEIYFESKENLVNMNSIEDMAYVLYTSGSTGQPKGVILEHRNVVNTLMYLENKYPLLEEDSYLLKTTYTFDVSVTELFGWFIGSGKLIILPPQEEKNIDCILNTIDKYKITHINFVPSMFSIFVEIVSNQIEKIESIKYVFVGGEVFPKELVNKFSCFTNGLSIENMYGPTETSIYVTKYSLNELMEERNIPIGKPIDNMKIYIVDEDINLQPIGVVGEVCISGIGVARGYLNNDNLTSQRFVKDLFNPGARMYKTGDFAKWLPNGNIEYIGRMDNQVKIRGFRIELEEIKNQLLDYGKLKEVIVIDDQDEAGSKYLCAFFKSDEKVDSNELRDYLALKIPYYMIPNYFIHVDKFPLNANGKVDRKMLLSSMKDVEIVQIYEAPSNSVEELLVSIWLDILKQENIGVTDDFFYLGGDSLKVILLLSRIVNTFNKKISIKDIYKAPTIREIAQCITQSSKSNQEIKHENLILLREGNEKSDNLFFIHDGSGDIGVYIELSTKLNLDLNIWGVRANKLNGFVPYDIKIESAAEEYIRLIKSIQPEGPYNIAGCSLGGNIGFEIVRQLESSKDSVSLFAIFDSYSPKANKNNTIYEFTIETEIKFIKSILPNMQIPQEQIDGGSIDDIWEITIDYISKNNISVEDIRDRLPIEIYIITSQFKKNSIEELIYNVNLIRTLNYSDENYSPNSKIKTQIYLFKAKESTALIPEGWNHFTEEPIQYKEIQGNHFTIFKSPNVEVLCTEFERLFTSENRSEIFK